MTDNRLRFFITRHDNLIRPDFSFDFPEVDNSQLMADDMSEIMQSSNKLIQRTSTFQLNLIDTESLFSRLTNNEKLNSKQLKIFYVSYC